MSGDAARHPLLAGYPVCIRIPVQWGDMDAYGHVNNTVFFRYFESARIAYLKRCGFLDSYEEQRVGAILHSTECRFRRALFHPDTVLVGGRATDVAADRFTMGYAVVSTAEDQLAAEGTGVVVSYDYGRREKCPLPARVRERIEELERAS
jgi:acyl-CoA thioester hydrolase